MSSALQTMPTGAELAARASAFNEIGALAQSGFFPKGITTVAQVKAICWMADAVGAHPMVALQECYVVHGKVGFTWRFKLGLIVSRLPQFEWEQVEATDAHVTLRARRTPERAWTEVTYTRAEAKKAGRFSNPLYETDWADMGFKQAMHRLLDRTAPEVLRGMPSPEIAADEGDAPVEAAEAARGDAAPALDAALDAAFEPVTMPAAAPEKPKRTTRTKSSAEVVVDAEPEPDARPKQRALGQAIVGLFGDKLTPAAAIEKASIIWNEMVKAGTGTDPKRKFGKGEIGEHEAGLMLDYLAKKEAARAARVAEQDREAETPDPVPFDEREPAFDDEVPAPPDEDDAPPPPDVEPDPRVARAAEREVEIDGSFEGFMRIVQRARKLLGRPFVKESPPSSGVWWFTDQKVYLELGYADGSPELKLKKAGEVVMPQERMTLLARTLRTLCDDHERGTR